MPPVTDEQAKDIAERVEKFKQGHAKLVQDLQVDITAFPMWVPLEDHTFRTAIRMDYADLKYRHPSPLAGLQ